MKSPRGIAVCGLAIFLAVGCENHDRSQRPQLKAGGSTFVFPLMAKWTSAYERAEVNYQSIGSGGGIHSTMDRSFDFGCSDAPLSDAELKQAQAINGEIIHVPLVLGAVVPAYNVPNVSDDLTFTGTVLADIYLGKIKKWNDKAIQELNPGIALPDEDIIVVHRLDGSGTTYIWSDYLSKVSGEWKTKVGIGTALSWPCGVAERGNEGVAQKVHDAAGSIGYVELSYAFWSGIPFGRVKNKDGFPIKATRNEVIAAAENAISSVPDDLRFSITDAPGKNSYPICGASWAILYVNQPPDKGQAIVDFLRWCLHDGQHHAEELHYAELPKSLIERAEKELDQVKVCQ